MRILIVSDTHRHTGHYIEALQEALPIDLVIHCGDVEGQERELEQLAKRIAGSSVVMVAGNNDFFSNLESERELELEGVKIWVTHGHNYYVNTGNAFLKKEAKARDFDIVLYGHTHKPVVDFAEGIIAVNPGSLTYPRQNGRRPTYLVMELEKGKAPDFTWGEL